MAQGSIYETNKLFNKHIYISLCVIYQNLFPSQVDACRMITHDYIKVIMGMKSMDSAYAIRRFFKFWAGRPPWVSNYSTYTVRRGESRLFIKASPAPSTMYNTMLIQVFNRFQIPQLGHCLRTVHKPFGI